MKTRTLIFAFCLLFLTTGISNGQTKDSDAPFFLNTFDEPETYSNIPVETRNRYLSLLKENHVDAVFAGHLHNNVSAKYGVMDMITTSAVGKPLGEAPSGIRIVKVWSDRIESVYYGVDEIPAKIIFSDNPASNK